MCPEINYLHKRTGQSRHAEHILHVRFQTDSNICRHLTALTSQRHFKVEQPQSASKSPVWLGHLILRPKVFQEQGRGSDGSNG